MGETPEVDPVTGVPLEDLLLTAAHIGTDVGDPWSGIEKDPEGKLFEPEIRPDVEVADRGGPPVVVGFHKIDADSTDEEIDAMAAAFAKEYGDAIRAAGLKMAPPGTLRVVSEGGVPVAEEDQ